MRRQRKSEIENPDKVEERLLDAEVALRLDRAEEAAAIYAELLGRSAGAGQRARLEAGLGQLAFRRGDAAAAIVHLERALVLDPRLRDPSVLDTLGRAYCRAGRVDAALELFRGALARAEGENDRPLQLRFGLLLANTLIDSAVFEEAAGLLARLATGLAGGDALAAARVHWTQARLHIQRHEHEAAVRYAQRAFDELEPTEHAYYRAKAHHLLAFAELDAGRAEEALRLLEDGLALLGEQGTSHDRAEFRLEQARALAVLGRADEAAALAMATAAAFQEGHRLNVGRSYAAVAEALEREGETARALELYELAVELLEQPPSRYLVDACARYGALLERVGRHDEAFSVFKRSAALQAQLERSRGAV